GRARHQAGGSPPETGAGSALARHHAFGYRRRVPGRHRHRRSRPSRPETRLTAFPSVEDEPAPPASLVAHGHKIIVLTAGSVARTVARRQIAACAKAACGGSRKSLGLSAPARETPSTTIRRQP